MPPNTCVGHSVTHRSAAIGVRAAIDSADSGALTADLVAAAAAFAVDDGAADAADGESADAGAGKAAAAGFGAERAGFAFAGFALDEAAAAPIGGATNSASKHEPL